MGRHQLGIEMEDDEVRAIAEWMRSMTGTAEPATIAVPKGPAGLIEKGSRPAMDERINLVKVFTATKMKDRESMGETVTRWIAENPSARILKTFVTLTSDDRFHCISIVLVCMAT